MMPLRASGVSAWPALPPCLAIMSMVRWLIGFPFTVAAAGPVEAWSPGLGLQAPSASTDAAQARRVPNLTNFISFLELLSSRRKPALWQARASGLARQHGRYPNLWGADHARFPRGSSMKLPRVRPAMRRRRRQPAAAFEGIADCRRRPQPDITAVREIERNELSPHPRRRGQPMCRPPLQEKSAPVVKPESWPGQPGHDRADFVGRAQPLDRNGLDDLFEDLRA